VVSTRIGTSEDVVSCTRNDFLKFSSLSSLINMTCHLFAEVAFYLMKMETTINVPLGLPLRDVNRSSTNAIRQFLITVYYAYQVVSSPDPFPHGPI
jgi:hypothetical protein